MKVEHITDGGRAYFAAIEEGQQIGELRYRMEKDSHMIINFVGINHSHRGGGRARELVMSVVEYARENDIKITPICSYACTIFDRYPDIHDVLYVR